MNELLTTKTSTDFTWLETVWRFLESVFLFDENSPLLFTQFYFWAFFAIIYCFFALFHNKRLLRNSFLFFVSLFFYYKTSGLFLLILLFVTVSDFMLAKRIHAVETEWKRKLLLIISVTIDLALLSYFKYAYFFTDMVNSIFGTELRVFDLFAWVGNGFATTGHFDVDLILLPVGISFYIFQVISYIMDVYRRKIDPVHNILDFGFYVSFFPQLVAGPIVRASEFVPQLYKPFFLTRKQFGIAVFWIINGLTKKIILSDYIAVNFVDRVFDNPLLFSGFENLMALFCYSLQVYADFSGYTDIAIGVAMLMGFYLPKNFNSPYKATNAGNFWKRWHISLSRWLQNYLYIPLGGSRNASFGTFFWIIVISLIALILSGNWIVTVLVLTLAATVTLIGVHYKTKRLKITSNMNRMITMLLGGLWHGASWNFMIWGGLNGIGIITYQFWKDWNMTRRFIAISVAWVVVAILHQAFPRPVFNLFFIWGAVIWCGTLVRFIYFLFGGQHAFERIGRAWGIVQTFTFVTFTRLFFRSGSNLDPAVANETAWNTAQNMVAQIGGLWQWHVIPQIVTEYYKVFAAFAVGMIIHWLPDHFKRHYRYTFAVLPSYVQVLTVATTIFVLYQFITSDLQAFIYFQF